MYRWLFLLAFYLTAIGTVWTAYESHIANVGVWAWQREFSQIQQPDGPSDNHAKLAQPPRFSE